MMVTQTRHSHRSVFSALRAAVSAVAGHVRDYALAAMVVQGAIAVLGIPFVIRLFGLLDASVEITSPTALGVGEALTNPVADLLLLAIVVAIAALAYLELAVMLSIA